MVGDATAYGKGWGTRLPPSPPLARPVGTYHYFGVVLHLRTDLLRLNGVTFTGGAHAAKGAMGVAVLRGSSSWRLHGRVIAGPSVGENDER